jgi:type I restriction enzyme S subunit
MNSWPELPLGDLLEIVIDHRGKTPKKLGGDFVDSGVPVVSAIHIKNGRINWERRERYVTEEMFKKWMPNRLQKGDVLLTSEAPLGETALISNDSDLVLSQRLFALRGRQDLLDSTYLQYFLSSPIGQNRLQQRSTGTTVVGIRQEELLKVLIPVPPIHEQRNIARGLSTLDRLIEVERGLAQNLDDLARLLGKRFVDGLDWDGSVPMTDLAIISKGFSYKSSELIPSNTFLVNLKNVGLGGEFLARGFKPLTANPKPGQYIENGEVLVAQTDLTHDRAVVGRPIRVRRGLVAERLVASLDLVVVRPNEMTSEEYIYAILDTPAFRAHALAHCNGTTVVHMASSAIPTFCAPIPDKSRLDMFSNEIRALRLAADDAIARSEQLRHTRDELLPMMLSGSIQVGEEAA